MGPGGGHTRTARGPSRGGRGGPATGASTSPTVPPPRTSAGSRQRYTVASGWASTCGGAHQGGGGGSGAPIPINHFLPHRTAGCLLVQPSKEWVTPINWRAKVLMAYPGQRMVGIIRDTTGGSTRWTEFKRDDFYVPVRGSRSLRGDLPPPPPSPLPPPVRACMGLSQHCMARGKGMGHRDWISTPMAVPTASFRNICCSCAASYSRAAPRPAGGGRGGRPPLT